MDTSRPNTEEEEQKNSRMTSNHPNANTYAYQENSYHQKPPSFNHKQVNISLVDDGLNNQKKQQKLSKTEKQQQASGTGEWRESIPIKLEHLLFNFKENSLKVYKASPLSTFIALLATLLLCGVLALVILTSSQRDDNLKKEANLPLDQSAIAERIIGESQLLNHHKLKNSLFDQKNQTGEKSRKNYNNSKLNDAKDAAVRKAFGSLLFSGDDNDEIEPDPEENNSDESFDGERSRSRNNFNLFLSDSERQNVADEQKEKLTSNDQQSENPKVMFIERLMGLHFGLQPKFGLSESLVIRKTIRDDENMNTSNGEDQTPPNGNKIKESRNKKEDPTPFLLKYAAAAMLSRVLAAAQQQAYIQQLQQQQRFREMNEKNIFNSPPPYYRGYRMMREPAESVMYGRPMHHPHKHHPQSTRPAGILPPPFQTAPSQFVSSDRGFSRGPLLSSEEKEAESQQIHPIILMLNIPYKEQQAPNAAQLMFMGQGQTALHQPTVETSIQPFFMPYAAGNSPPPRQNPYYKPTRDQQPPVYSSPFAHHKNHNYYPQQSLNEGYYAHHPYNTIQPINRVNAAVAPPPASPQRYNHRMTNTIEVPIEIHHQVSPSLSSAAHHTVTHQPTAQIIVQPQLESSSQPNENDQDQSNENEHHMVVFYDSSDNISHSEENNSNNQPQLIDNSNNQPRLIDNSNNQPQQPAFVKERESKLMNNNLEKQQIGKMLLLHFVNSNNNVASSTNQQQPQLVNSAASEQQTQQSKILISQQEQPSNVEKQQQQINSQNKPQLEIAKNEEEKAPASDQMNREENFEKLSPDNPNESEAEPASLAHFAQVIQHVIDQQQQQNQEQRQAQLIQPAITPQKKSISSSISTIVSQSQSQQAPTSSIQQQLNQSRKEIQVENSNKEVPQIEKSQESVQSPAFAMLVAGGENDEN